MTDEKTDALLPFDIPEGFRMTKQQATVWQWAASHGLTLLADDCNDLLWRLEEINQTARNAVDVIEDIYSMEIAEPGCWQSIREGLGMQAQRRKDI